MSGFPFAGVTRKPREHAGTLRSTSYPPTLVAIHITAMESSLQAEADRRFSEALERTGARDPRDYYRERLKELRSSDPQAYQEAVSYYRDTLIPRVADPDSDPMVEWRAYGLEIARLTAPGQTVSVDPTGRAQPFQEPCAEDAMVLHLPDGRGPTALLVGLPPAPSEAQVATYDWLVGRERALRQPSSTM
ncbi:MAG: hypothetical protein OEO23_04075 [Gemmatimonadota bacterium]|nr:hypothetical protein [Gemmatimonadota bacterium]